MRLKLKFKSEMDQSYGGLSQSFFACKIKKLALKDKIKTPFLYFPMIKEVSCS